MEDISVSDSARARSDISTRRQRLRAATARRISRNSSELRTAHPTHPHPWSLNAFVKRNRKIQGDDVLETSRVVPILYRRSFTCCSRIEVTWVSRNKVYSKGTIRCNDGAPICSPGFPELHSHHEGVPCAGMKCFMTLDHSGTTPMRCR